MTRYRYRPGRRVPAMERLLIEAGLDELGAVHVQWLTVDGGSVVEFWSPRALASRCPWPLEAIDTPPTTPES